MAKLIIGKTQKPKYPKSRYVKKVRRIAFESTCITSPCTAIAVSSRQYSPCLRTPSDVAARVGKRAAPFRQANREIPIIIERKSARFLDSTRAVFGKGESLGRGRL